MAELFVHSFGLLFPIIILIGSSDAVGLWPVLSLLRVGGCTHTCSCQIVSVPLCWGLTFSPVEAPLRPMGVETPQQDLWKDWPPSCCLHLMPRQRSLGQNRSLINTFHRVNGGLAAPPAWGSSQSHGLAWCPETSPAWGVCASFPPRQRPILLTQVRKHVPCQPPPKPPAVSFSPSPAPTPKEARGTVLWHLIYFFLSLL